MRWPFRRLAVCLAALLFLPGVSRGAEAPEAHEAQADPFARELTRRIQGKAPLDDVRVDVRWPVVDHYESIRLFGRGLLICDGKAQLTVSRDAVLSALKDLRDGRFAAMEDRYGSEEKRKSSKPEERARRAQAQRGTGPEGCRGGAARAPSPRPFSSSRPAINLRSLDALARKLLSVCRDAGSGDSGQRVESRRRAAEADLGRPRAGDLRLILHRRSESKVGDAGESSSSRCRAARHGPAPCPRDKLPAPRSLLLPAADCHGPGALPRRPAHRGDPGQRLRQSLPDLRVTVLDRERSIMAQVPQHHSADPRREAAGLRSRVRGPSRPPRAGGEGEARRSRLRPHRPGEKERERERREGEGEGKEKA